MVFVGAGSTSPHQGKTMANVNLNLNNTAAVWTALGLPDMTATAFAGTSGGRALSDREGILPIRRGLGSARPERPPAYRDADADSDDDAGRPSFRTNEAVRGGRRGGGGGSPSPPRRQWTRPDLPAYDDDDRGSNYSNGESPERVGVAGRASRRHHRRASPETRRLQEAWLGEGGLTRAHESVVPRSPAGPAQIDVTMRAAYLSPHAEPPPLHGHGSGLPMRPPATGEYPEAPFAKSAAAAAGRAGETPPERVAEVIDSIKRCVFDFRTLHSSVEEGAGGGGKRRADFTNLAGYAVAPMPSNEWAEAVVLMKGNLRESADSVDVCLGPLYRGRADGGGGGGAPRLRVDDALFPLVFLLQAAAHLRDTVAGATGVRANFFGTKELGKYVSDSSHAEAAVLFAVSLVQEAVSRPDSDPPDRRDVGVAILAELVPCPSSRRFWAAHFGVTALEVQAKTFCEALLPALSDVVGGVAHSVAWGIAHTLALSDESAATTAVGGGLSSGAAVTLCAFSALFGDLSLPDSLDKLVSVGVSAITYALFIIPVSEWNPPRRRHKEGAARGDAASAASTQGRAGAGGSVTKGMLDDLLRRATLPTKRDVCEACVARDSTVAELKAEVERLSEIVEAGSASGGGGGGGSGGRIPRVASSFTATAGYQANPWEKRSASRFSSSPRSQQQVSQPQVSQPQPQQQQPQGRGQLFEPYSSPGRTVASPVATPFVPMDTPTPTRPRTPLYQQPQQQQPAFSGGSTLAYTPGEEKGEATFEEWMARNMR